MTSQSEQPSPSRLPSGGLSKVAGAGAGGVIVVIATWLDLKPQTTLVVQALAPSIAVLVAAIGPIVNKLAATAGKWIGLQLTLRTASKLARSMPEGTPGQADAEKNIEMIHAALNEIIHDTLMIFRTRP